MTEGNKVRENRIRRMAERQGYQLMKSRRRDPSAADFGTYGIIDPARNAWILSGPNGFGYDLEPIDAWFHPEYKFGCPSCGSTNFRSVDGSRVEPTGEFDSPSLAPLVRRISENPLDREPGAAFVGNLWSCVNGHTIDRGPLRSFLLVRSLLPIEVPRAPLPANV